MHDWFGCYNYIVISVFVFCLLCEKLSMETIVLYTNTVESVWCYGILYVLYIILYKNIICIYVCYTYLLYPFTVHFRQTRLMAASRVANQRRWDSHMIHVRTTDRCSSLTSAPQQKGGSSVPGMPSRLAGPHTEHAPPAISTASSSSRTSKQPEVFGASRRPYIVFRFRCLYGFIFVCVYIYIYIYI